MIDFLTEILSHALGASDQKRKSFPSIVIVLFLMASLLLTVLELQWIFHLTSPLIFVITFLVVGLFMGVLIFILFSLWTPTDQKLLIVSLVMGVLLSVSLASIINRIGLDNINGNQKAIIASKPLIGKNISRIKVTVGDALFELRSSVGDGYKFQKGDTIMITRFSGNLGFELVTPG